jgi:glyoxylase-like metal-dependent hydrolase (beta-lactamase superfamily II)
MTPSTSTSSMLSVDSGQVWTEEGPWQVAPGIHRVPLPLPTDGLRAVNVYVIEGQDGLTLIDGGWAIPEAREVLDRSLARLGANVRDIRRFLVTHVHRDHYTLASELGAETDADVMLGLADRPTLEIARRPDRSSELSLVVLTRAGARELGIRPREGALRTNVSAWGDPRGWLVDDVDLDLGHRTLSAVHTPGHTPGHFVFADVVGGVLFSGDHVLPTITPSIGFVLPPPQDPLGDFMASLAKVKAIPDLALLPAHGSIATSSHARVDVLLEHHERRLDLASDAIRAGCSTAYEVAHELTWTRHERRMGDLETFDQVLAVRETLAHLDLLVARGHLSVERVEGINIYAVSAGAVPAAQGG